MGKPWREYEWVRDRRGRFARRTMAPRDPYVTTAGEDKNWRNRSRAGLGSEPRRRGIKTTRIRTATATRRKHR